jgi:hypothetical protein
MPSKPSGIYKRAMFISITVLLLTSVYQNCSSELDNTLVSNIPPPKTLSTANAAEVPFAFETSMNELAYMSCSHIDSDFNADHMGKFGTYFTFKIGAYGNNSGVSLTSDFRSYLTSNYGDSNESVPDSIVQSAFTITPQNAWPALVFSNRPMSDPVNLIYRVNSGGDKPVVTNEFDILLSPNFVYSSLTYGENLKQLSELMKKPSVTKVNYFNQQGTGHNLAGSLNYHYSPEYSITSAQALRNRFSDGQNSNMLTVTYSQDLRDPKNQPDPYISRRTFKDTDNGSAVWGRGYQPSFGFDPRVNGLGNGNVLSGISEYDLSEGLKPVVTNWSCNTRYLIISPLDNDDTVIAHAYPNPYGDPIPTFSRCNDPSDLELSASQKDERQMIQRYLSATDWIINPVHKCLVPRTGNGDCYQKRKPDSNNVKIETIYRKTAAETCGVGTPYACPEFLSICTRN